MNVTRKSKITVQYAVATKKWLPKRKQFIQWVELVLAMQQKPGAEMTIRIVEKDEMSQLNSLYREKNKPTNVLSFPLLPPLLGDLVICAEVVLEEARSQQKTPEAHWAHMVIHGTLHLLGYDHEKAAEADIMEANEVIMLKQLGFANPYQLIKED